MDHLLEQFSNLGLGDRRSSEIGEKEFLNVVAETLGNIASCLAPFTAFPGQPSTISIVGGTHLSRLRATSTALLPALSNINDFVRRLLRNLDDGWDGKETKDAITDLQKFDSPLRIVLAALRSPESTVFNVLASLDEFILSVGDWLDNNPAPDPQSVEQNDVAKMNYSRKRNVVGKGFGSDAAYGTEPRLTEAEKVSLVRLLDYQYPGQYRRELISALSLWAKALYQENQLPKALGISKEVIFIERTLHVSPTAAETHSFAANLRNHAAYMESARLWDEAYEAANESFELYRQLFLRDPDTFRPELAKSLMTLGIALSQVNRSSDAVEALEEAVGVYRTLYTMDTREYHEAFAASLSSLARAIDEVRSTPYPSRELSAYDTNALRREASAIYLGD